MKRYVTDTHTLYWYLLDSPRLGTQASNLFDEAAAGRAKILIPAIVLAELFYLNAKQGRPLDFTSTYAAIKSGGQFELVPFDPIDVLEFDTDAAVFEMHDRIIVGAARKAGAVCITRDAAIISSGAVLTVW